MPEEKSSTAAEVAERIATQDTQKTTGIKGEPEAQATEQVDAEVADVLGEATESSDAVEESPTPLKTDDAADADAEAEDEVGELLKAKVEPKDNVQKRIDQLTAKIKQLESENEKYKKPAEKGEPEYSDAQIRKALADAMEKGDSDLIFEIIEYKSKKVERDLRKAYQDDINERQQAQSRINTEWQKVVMDYSKVWEEDGKEIYQGASKELNINNMDSLLYRTARALYDRVDENGHNPYLVPGGQKQAVADALLLIMKKRRLSGNEKKLERALSKEKRKKSLGSGTALESESVPKPKNLKEDLSDYLGSRNKFLNERK